MFNLDKFYSGDVSTFEGYDIGRNHSLGIKWVDTKIEYGSNNTNNKKCVVAIPVYKKTISGIEAESLKQVVKILGDKYDIILVCPKNFDVKPYNECANYDFSTLRCNELYFKSQKSYSDMCEEWQFYNAFNEYEFMLIYQLDAWIFEDKLDYFIKMNYDYIGAIHLIGFSRNNKEGENGNGGFSLRKIQKFIDVCKKTNFSKYNSLEDCVFTQNLKYNFNLAPLNVCRQFSFQDRPKLCFVKNGNKLPMGCHAFMKFGIQFWSKYIDIKINTKEELPTTLNERLNHVISNIYGSSNYKNKTVLKKHKLIRRFR